MASWTTNSASIAANPCANTGASTVALPLARCSRTLEDRAHQALRAVFLAERLGDPADLPAGDGIAPQRYGLVLASICGVEILRLRAGILRERASGAARLYEFGGHPLGVEREVGDNGNQFMNLLYFSVRLQAVLYRETGVIFNVSRGHCMSNRRFGARRHYCSRKCAAAAETPLAFPGARGAVAAIPGGRGGEIVRVTTLAPSGLNRREAIKRPVRASDV